MLRWTSLILLVGVASCTKPPPQGAGAALSAPTSVAPSQELVANSMLPPKVYTDGVGIVVEVVPLKVPKGQQAQALVRVSGVKSVISGVTFLCQRSARTEPDAWTTRLDGVTGPLLNLVHSKGSIDTQLVLPRKGGSKIYLRESPEASKLVDVDDLIADYRSNLNDGSIEKLSRFDHSFARKKLTEQIELGRGQFETSCGDSVEVAMVWDSMSTSRDYNQGYFCTLVLKDLARLCEVGLANKEKVTADIDHVRCKLEDTVSLQYRGASKTLEVGGNWTQMADAGNSSTAVWVSKEIGMRGILLKTDTGLYAHASPVHTKVRRLHVGFGSKLYMQWGNNPFLGRTFSFWTPTTQVSLTNHGLGNWSAACPSGQVVFKEVIGPERARALSTLALEEPLWTRQVYLLARDTKGTYFYVDAKRTELGGLDYRLYKGPRGRLTRTQMVDVVVDKQGDIFTTTKGSLRITPTDESFDNAQWVTGKKATDLVVVNVFETKRLVFGDLGVYDGLETGTLCALAKRSPE